MNNVKTESASNALCKTKEAKSKRRHTVRAHLRHSRKAKTVQTENRRATAKLTIKECKGILVRDGASRARF